MDVPSESGFTAFLKTEIGLLRVTADHTAVTEISFVDNAKNPGNDQKREADPPHMTACLAQLEEYFSGQRKKFDLPLSMPGTAFQKKVWHILLKVPYGQTWSYQELAIAVGRPKAFRAVGGANHRNPLSIIVPCHRIIGADGSLTGYGGGLWRKEWLLQHEQGNL
jgi:methylated-DNA-[protein]-cysteine S-methyltransferase